MKNKLKEHYNSKYGKDDNINLVPIISSSPWPQNRYEACIKWFVDNHLSITMNNVIEIGAGDGRIAKSLLNLKLPIKNYTITESMS